MSKPPPYLRIAEDLRGRIMALPPGDKLPSTTELGKQHSVAPSVAGRAYQVLVQEGLVISRHGSGHYVRGMETPEVLVRRHQRGSPDSPFAVGVTQQGAVGSWRHESATATADGSVAERLGIAEGAAVMRTDYVYLAEDQPVQLATSWEPLAVTGQSAVVLPEAGPHAGIGVAARMQLLGMDVGDPVEAVRARSASRAEAHSLGVSPQSPVLSIERTYYDQASGRAVETADIVLRGDRWVSVYGRRP
ncbi:GntR family transcriptional regulator [Streptomyces sp. NPDC002734]|uniref:GntR family transcriptional regulator n=1 Tax=Streptomyces sp. NPDC002734 TaxID=3154426 RepID=UPI003320F3E5